MKKKTPQIQYGKSYRYTSNERAIKDLLKIEKRQKEEKAERMLTLHRTLHDAQASASLAQTRRLCAQDAVKVNGKVERDPQAAIHIGDVIHVGDHTAISVRNAKERESQP